jgi:hypothetical protein
VIALAALVTGCTGKETGATTTTTGTAPPPPTTTTTEVPLEGGRQVAATDYIPSVGDCFDQRKAPSQVQGQSRQVDVVLLVRCDQPHENEVYATLDYPPPDPKNPVYPGDDVVRRWAKQQCPPLFKAYVGQSYELSSYAIAYVLPSQAHWPSSRVVACELTDPAARELGSSGRGSNQ